jgi:hypothetical protein
VEENLIVSDEVKRDMLSYTASDGDQIEDFLLLLAENPFSPAMLKASVDQRDGCFRHQLPSGCWVFWEVLLPEIHPRFGTLDGVLVRVTGAKFDFSAK